MWDNANLDPAQMAQMQQNMNALGGNPVQHGHPGFAGRMGGSHMFSQYLPQIQGAFDQNQGNFDGFKNALMGMYPGLGHQMHGAPTPGSPAPNTQFPLNPGAGGPIQGQQQTQPTIGSSMGVTGATPASSPFGLPHY